MEKNKTQKKKNLLQSEKLVSLLVSANKNFVLCLMKKKYHAIKHNPDIEDLIEKVWLRCVFLYYLIMKYEKVKKRIIFTLEFPLKNKWMIFLDKLNTSEIQEQNTLHIYLFQTLLQELILKEKDLSPFWTPAYKELSGTLLLPTEIDSVGLPLISLESSLKKVEDQSQCLMINKIKVQNKSYQKTYFQLSTSTVADKWVNEVTKEKIILKALKIQLKPSKKQINILNQWINTSNYVYNKTVDRINNHKHKVDFISLRDLLVTQKTKKNHNEYKILTEEAMDLHRKKFDSKITDEEKNVMKLRIKDINLKMKEISKSLSYEKNGNITDWEVNTPKEMRAGAVNDVCKAYKTAMTNLRDGNIHHFRLGFKKKNNPNKSIVISKNSKIQIDDKKMSFHRNFFDKDTIYFKIKNKKYKNIQITNDCRIIKSKNKYWLIVPVEEKIKDKKRPVNYCGVDMGIKTFATTFGNNGCLEYKHDYVKIKLEKLNAKIDILKKNRIRQKRVSRTINKRISKRIFNKYENRKINIVNELHWKTINNMVSNNDFIMYGDIKSHDIVSHGIKYNYKKKLNRDFNDLKFYKFKERLKYKVELENKKVFFINESYTTQTCSFCGNMYKPGFSRVYNCPSCKVNIGRDVNAAKNILMKGIILNM
jgi:IS605 OrfB family transposase